MTIDFICEVIAEYFDIPCNYSPIDEQMLMSERCADDCGDISRVECWKRWFMVLWDKRKDEQTEPQNDCHRNRIRQEDGEYIYECIGCQQTDCEWK